MTDTVNDVETDSGATAPDVSGLDVTIFLVVTGLAIAVVVLLVQLRGLREDVANIHLDSGSSVSGTYLEDDVADLCRMVGALAAQQGIRPAELLSTGDGATGQVWSDCTYAAIDAGR